MIAGRSSSYERVHEWINQPGNISNQQRDAVVHTGDLFLVACPGAGKTRTVGVRLAWNSVNPIADGATTRRRRTAAVSYTNVAVDEIGAAAERAGSRVSEPDFLGTIHRFLLRYVVRPFAMKPMGCSSPPRLITDPVARDDFVEFRERYVTRRVSAWDLHFDSKGNLSLAADADVLHESNLSAEQIAARIQQEAKRLKRKLASEGLLSMSDAMYWAQQALEVDEHAQTVAARFDELIVDEAQDTTDTQLRALERLKHAGLRSLVLVGDPNQAIYGFAGADPAEVRRLASTLQLDQSHLTENWRSSQLICNASKHFRAESEADDAVGEHHDASHKPELILYPAESPRLAVERFLARLSELGLSHDRIAVLSRGRATRDALNRTGGGVFSGRLANLAELAAAAQEDHTIGRTVVQEIEADLVRHAWPNLLDDEIDNEHRFRLRSAVFELATRLPDLGLTSKDWCRDARIAVNDAVENLKYAQAGQPLTYRASSPRGTGPHNVRELLDGRRGAAKARTIHAVKGESYDATLTVAVETDHYNNARDWLDHSGEERRIAYVALTRAKVYSAIAVPDTTDSLLIDEFARRGFSPLP